MNDPRQFDDPLANASQEEMMAALFANMVVQQAQTAYMFLGKTPNPETGETMVDLETAKYFIEQLEMLAHKTRGNLDRQEEGLLKQSLTTLRLAFVEAAGGKGAPGVIRPAGPEPEPPREKASEAAASPVEAPRPAAPPAAPAAPAPTTLSSEAAAPEESRKKFSKRY